MHRFLTALLLVCLAGGLAGAQVWMDAFNYPAGPNLGTWVKHLSAQWTATGTQVRAQLVTKYQHLTQPNQVFRDGAADVDVDFNPTQGLQFGGVILRANAPSKGTFGSDLVLIKVQGSTNFNHTWLYEHSQTGGLSAASAAIPACTKARVRLLVLDSRAVARIDCNRNGKWDVTVNKTISLPVKAGPVGICGYNGSFMDEYKTYNSVILEETSSTPMPSPGTEYKMVIRGTPGDGYQAAASLGTSGVVLPNGYVLPLTADPLLFASASNALPALFKNFRGFLDINGDAKISVAVPNLPVLSGLTFYVAFVSFKGTTFVTVSNDHQVVIQ